VIPLDLAQRLGELRAELSRLSERLADPTPPPSSEAQRLRLELEQVETERASLFARAREAFARRDALDNEVAPLREARALPPGARFR
jgi:hypothetical protein